MPRWKVLRKIPIRKQLWICCLLSLLTACYWHSQRWQQESHHKKVEMVLDFNSLADLARSRGLDWQTVLPEFTSCGVSGLAFSELKVDELESYGICTVYSGVALGAETSQGSGGEGLPNPHYTYLVQWTQKGLMSAAELQKVCEEAFGRDKVKAWPSPPETKIANAAVLQIALPLRTVQAVGVCFPRWAMTHKELSLWLRPENKPPITQPAVRAYLDRLKSLQPEGVIFGGSANEVLGYPDQLDETAACIKDYGWKLGFIELAKIVQQKGVETLVRQLPQQTVRVFTVPPKQQETLQPERVAQMYGLAARERNLTVLYLRPYAYDPSPDKGFEDANKVLFGGIQHDLHDRLGRADTFQQEVKLPAWAVALLSLAGLSAFWLVLGEFFPIRRAWAAGSLVIFATLNLLLALTPLAHLWLALMALGTACCISTLSVVSQFGGLRQAAEQKTFSAIMLQSTHSWLRMGLISLAGAWIASCFLQETSYKLGLDIFRGVKVITVIMPVVITVLWALSGPDRQHWLSLGGSPLKLYQLVGLSILAVGGLVYTMRTGNMAGTDVGESMEAERYVRMVLDQALGVRPRFKEFLLAHPAMLMAPLMLRWGWRELAAVMVLIGATGQCGLFDTFAHVHTPLYISLVRCLMGALFGCALGWVYAGILWTLAKVARRLQRKMSIST